MIDSEVPKISTMAKFIGVFLKHKENSVDSLNLNLNQSRTTLDIVTWNELLSNSPQHWNMELITLEQP